MITKLDLQERVREWALTEEVIEKDYVLGWLLWGIGSDESLSQTWIFKGGTCLKKCYIETYRFSEDLDFTVLPNGSIKPSDLESVLRNILQRVSDESGITFSARPPTFKHHDSGNYTQGRIYYQGPRNAPTVSVIILDLSASERVIRPPVALPITHSYPDQLPEPRTVRCYAFEELFAEKIRAMGERSRPRDLYDIVNLYRRPDLGTDPKVISAVLAQKCQNKGVPIPTLENLAASPFRVELESEWDNMLRHQLAALPPFESFWTELPGLFGWLQGAREIEVLAPAPADPQEQGAAPLVLPRTVTTWGYPVPVEAIRFAGANRLCVKLGYQGTTRIIEPYSLRRTNDGNLLLHAIKRPTGEHRSYRVDRIQSVETTNQPFTPVYAVEFSQGGLLHIPPTSIDYESRRTAAPRAPSRPRGIHSHRTFGMTYSVECPYCQKRFRRDRPDTTLNPHKNSLGMPCPGRRGFIVS